MAPTDHEAEKKREERWWMDFGRRYFPGVLPDGVIEQPRPPAPDALIACDGCMVGVEISQMLPERTEKYTPSQVMALQREVLNEACGRHRKKYGDHLFVNVSFAPGMLPPKTRLIDELVELVATHKPTAGESFAAHVGGAGLSRRFPAWLHGLKILHESPQREACWYGASAGSVPELKYEQVGDRIREKAKRLDGYRKYADEVWLLLVCDQRRVSTDVSIPREAANWRFAHPFDRVLLLSMQEVLQF